MTSFAAAFPDNSGYVIAAYLVFFAILFVYLAITAFRLVNIERRLSDLSDQLDAAPPTVGGDDPQRNNARAKDAAA